MDREEKVVEFLSIPLRDAKPLYVPLYCKAWLECDEDEPALVVVGLKEAA